MKPINLKFYGLNSFICPQEIDFTKLTTGVFGIFGKTGSGKTTILDAIILALYGQISKSTKAVDFINSKCSETGVELVFKIGTADDKTYFVERKYRKRKDTTIPMAWFGELVGEDKQTLAEGTRDVDAKIKDIVGLSFNEFSKCIALPQGEFAGFLNATAAERTEIISNIFSLQEYGDKLVDKIKTKFHEADTRQQVLEAQKAILGEIKEEDIDSCQNQIIEKQAEIDLLTNQIQQKNEKYQEQKRILGLIKRKQECVSALEELYQQRAEYKEKGVLCEKQRRALIISGDIKRVQELTKSSAELKKQVLEMSTQKTEVQNKLNGFVSENEDFEKHYQSNLIALTKKETDLVGAVEDEMVLMSLKNEEDSLIEHLQELNLECERAKLQKEEKEKELALTKEKIEDVESQLLKIEDNEIEFSLKEIKEIESEIIIYQTLEKQVEKLIDNNKNDIEFAQIEYSKLIKQEKEISENLAKENIDVEDVLNGNLFGCFQELKQAQEKLVLLEELEKRLEFVDVLIAQKESNIRNKQERIAILRSDYYKAGQEGQGDNGKEIKAEINFINTAIEDEKNDIDNYKALKDRLYLKVVDNNSERESNFKALKAKYQIIRDRIEKTFALQSEDCKYIVDIQMRKIEQGTRILVAKENSQILLDLLFGLQKFRAEHEFVIFNARERLSEQNIVDEGKGLNDIKRQKELLLRELLKEQTENSEALAKTELLVQSLLNNIEGLNEKINNIKLQIKVKQDSYEEAIKGFISATTALAQVRQQISDLTERFEYNQEKRERLKKAADKIVQEFTISSKILDEQTKELSDISFELNGRIFDLGFKDVDEVRNLITSENQIFKAEEELRQYKERVGLIEKELKTLSEEVGNSYIDEKEFQLLEKQIEDFSSRRTQEQILVGTLISNLSNLRADYEKLKKIEAELPIINKTLDDSKELLNLLRGKALVEYIAEEYMLEITRNANAKLNMLMGGRYELDFNSNNFVVYDNFNDHLPRPVQTLSGGETFLVSLSLALAISETISFSSNKSMEFFFLDEGFGTLDSELVESVISALYKLESQNLKIGLISHVKELEEEIKNKILVEKATDTEGSNLKIVQML